MTATRPLGTRIRAALHVVCTLAVGVLLAAPMLFGPASTWAFRAMGGAPEHLCACGMKQGTCGCPECAEKEHAHALALATAAGSKRVVVRSRCDDDESQVPGAAPLPRGTMPGAVVAIVPIANDASLPPSPQVLRPRDRERPPLPPPRRAV